jgi:hypothetical protein
MKMSKIKKLTQTIRNYSECKLDYGTLKTLKMIDDEAARLETKLQNTSIKSACVNAVNSWCLLHSKETAPESLIQAIWDAGVCE